MTPGEHISGLKGRDIPAQDVSPDWYVSPFQGRESMMDFEPYEAVICGKGTVILSV